MKKFSLSSVTDILQQAVNEQFNGNISLASETWGLYGGSLSTQNKSSYGPKFILTGVQALEIKKYGNMGAGYSPSYQALCEGCV